MSWKKENTKPVIFPGSEHKTKTYNLLGVIFLQKISRLCMDLLEGNKDNQSEFAKAIVERLEASIMTCAEGELHTDGEGNKWRALPKDPDPVLSDELGRYLSDLLDVAREVSRSFVTNRHKPQIEAAKEAIDKVLEREAPGKRHTLKDTLCEIENISIDIRSIQR